MILTPGVFKIMKEKYPRELKEGLKLKKSSVYVTKKDVKFSFTVTDSYFSLSLFYNDGIFDSKNDVISYDPSALRWGERIFSYFLKESEKIESVD